jgi:UDP-N-acetylmuramoyl-L-alanyl-D-glutamate--2,6-diaminopimelate ligase
LLKLLGGEKAVEDAVISGLAIDSRSVVAGDLFVAVPGEKLDGRKFIADAVQKGAAAVLTSTGHSVDVNRTVPIVESDNPRRLYAQIAARFCGEQPEYQVAVTGTNGKTSVADFSRQLWRILGHNAASIGTLGVLSDDYSLPGGLTTPDPMTLHNALSDLRGVGVSRCAIEASSHGLDQYRLDGVQLQAAAFTNLTRDHLDYHKNEQAYFYAKARLFGELLKPSAVAVLNLDDVWGRVLDDIAWGRKLTRLGYGWSEKATIRISELQLTTHGQTASLMIDGKQYTLPLNLVGEFQVMNVCAAIGLVMASGVSVEQVVNAASQISGVPGRMEFMGTYSGASVFVDYAHTPDGLRTVLEAARAHAPKKLHVVFGCGGDRDVGKRPLMGEIAAQLADQVYVTDDNPRGENPSEIRRQIMTACSAATEVPDRASAIFSAIEGAGDGDMVVIAGKGHETGQVVGDEILNFSDIETVKTLISRSVLNSNRSPSRSKEH